MNTIEDVKQFHLTFGHPALDTPQIPSEDRCNLRVNLLVEEVKELATGIYKKDIVEIADALADIQYVLNGAILEFGLAEKFPALFAEVHRSNMSKACKTEKEAKETVLYHTKKGDDGYYEYDENKKVFFVYRNSDKKLLKSINYSPADLKSIVNGK